MTLAQQEEMLTNPVMNPQLRRPPPPTEPAAYNEGDDAPGKRRDVEFHYVYVEDGHLKVGCNMPISEVKISATRVYFDGHLLAERGSAEAPWRVVWRP